MRRPPQPLDELRVRPTPVSNTCAARAPLRRPVATIEAALSKLRSQVALRTRSSRSGVLAALRPRPCPEEEPSSAAGQPAPRWTHNGTCVMIMARSASGATSRPYSTKLGRARLVRLEVQQTLDAGRRHRARPRTDARGAGSASDRGGPDPLGVSLCGEDEVAAHQSRRSSWVDLEQLSPVADTSRLDGASQYLGQRLRLDASSVVGQRGCVPTAVPVGADHGPGAHIVAAAPGSCSHAVRHDSSRFGGAARAVFGVAGCYARRSAAEDGHSGATGSSRAASRP